MQKWNGLKSDSGACPSAKARTASSSQKAVGFIQSARPVRHSAKPASPSQLLPCGVCQVPHSANPLPSVIGEPVSRSECPAGFAVHRSSYAPVIWGINGAYNLPSEFRCEIIDVWVKDFKI